MPNERRGGDCFSSADPRHTGSSITFANIIRDDSTIAQPQEYWSSYLLVFERRYRNPELVLPTYVIELPQESTEPIAIPELAPKFED